jgi:hypothetical protein
MEQRQHWAGPRCQRDRLPVGFGFALAVEAAGTERRDLRLGPAGLVANLLIAAFWVVLIVGALLGSS